MPGLHQSIMKRQCNKRKQERHPPGIFHLQFCGQKILYRYKKQQTKEREQSPFDQITFHKQIPGLFRFKQIFERNIQCGHHRKQTEHDSK